MNQKYCRNIYILIGFVASLLLFVNAAQAAQKPVQMTGEVVYVSDGEGFYGIQGDDGRKYQPLNLPKDLRKAGIVILFTALPKETFSEILWGQIVDIQAASKAKPVLPASERRAIQAMRERLDALNHHDLERLKKIDEGSANLTQAQLEEWIGDHKQFILRYVQIHVSKDSLITASALYTRTDPAGNIQVTQLDFTLNRDDKGWRITESESRPCEYTLEEILQAAKEHYGVEDLSKLWQ